MTSLLELHIQNDNLQAYKIFESLNQVPSKIQNLDPLDLAVTFGASQITKHIINTQKISENNLRDLHLIAFTLKHTKTQGILEKKLFKLNENIVGSGISLSF